MSTNNLESLLSEYEQKRRKAEMDLDERIENLYKTSISHIGYKL